MSICKSPRKTKAFGIQMSRECTDWRALNHTPIPRTGILKIFVSGPLNWYLKLQETILKHFDLLSFKNQPNSFKLFSSIGVRLIKRLGLLEDFYEFFIHEGGTLNSKIFSFNGNIKDTNF